ncbi:MAG: glycoside hydrolase family 16 protein, partial [Candidatus Cryptobacteroides sp.]
IDVPEGWDAWFEGSNLVVKVPSDYKDGTYSLKLLASTASAQPKSFDFKFKYEKDLILFDDFLGNDIDYRWWQRYVHGAVTNDWNRYQDGAPEESVVEDGLLKLYAHIWGDSYRTGAIWTKDKLTYKPPFRVDCRARFTDMGTGIWYAIWVVPETSYMYGEIDICEKLNYGTLTYHTVHTMYTLNTAKEHQNKETYVDDQGRTVSNSNQGKAQNAMVAGEFNTFSVEVTDEQIVFYVNDIPVHRYLHFVHSVEDPVYSQLKDSEKEVYLQNWTFMEQDYNTILDVAVGGQFVGGVIRNDEFPGQFDIDWIKVKQL